MKKHLSGWLNIDWHGGFTACASVALSFLLANQTHASQDETPLPGRALVTERSKGNCLACHVINEGVLPGNLGPPLVVMKARFPDREELRKQIHDASLANKHSRMPPFGRHRILTAEEIELIMDYLYTL
jgi:sulfur-oxidizing protein SoxX